MDTKLTEREREVMAASWHFMKSQPEYDFKALGEHLGITAKSAGNCMGVVRKKLGMPSGSPGKPKSKKAGETKVKHEDAAESEDGDTSDALIAKKPKATMPKKRGAPQSKSQPAKKRGAGKSQAKPDSSEQAKEADDNLDSDAEVKTAGVKDESDEDEDEE